MQSVFKFVLAGVFAPLFALILALATAQPAEARLQQRDQYLSACEAGDLDRCLDYARDLSSNNPTEEHVRDAIAVWQMLCTRDYGSACARAGLRYARGEAVGQNWGRAVTMYLRGCRQPDALACFKLAELYRDGEGGVQHNPHEAFRLFAIACNADIPLTQACAPAQTLLTQIEQSNSLAGRTFKDCQLCPEMVVIPAGRFTIGPNPGESDANYTGASQRQVTISRPFAVARHEVMGMSFGQFVRATQRDIANIEGCRLYVSEANDVVAGSNFNNPGFPQYRDSPAICVSWQDARDYTAWLAEGTGLPYRLLTEAEWEYVARAGSADPMQTGQSWMCHGGNLHDLSTQNLAVDRPRAQCHDGSIYTSPVMSYTTNAFGVFDMQGNVSEWVEDCWNREHAGGPLDGSAREGDCTSRARRGLSWIDAPGQSANSVRRGVDPRSRHATLGFRIARDLE